ncbi:MAG TPA: maltotransferase domain-containing protein, partial [Pseudonocardia sp.]
MTGRIGIDDVTPAIDGHPTKAVVGEAVPIRAIVWREGHDAVGANVVWSGPAVIGASAPVPHQARMVPEGVDSDRWVATVVPDAVGLWTFRVDGWSDPWATWVHAINAKVGAGQSAEELANDLETGARLLDRAGRRPSERPNRPLL